MKHNNGETENIEIDTETEGVEEKGKAEDIEITRVKAHYENWKHAENLECATFEEVIAVCKKWLYLGEEGNEDYYFILVPTAAILDRELEGDPIWLFLVTPSGGLKTELLRALSAYSKAYTLDILTPQTFISGLTRRNKDTGEPEPVGGLLKRMDGKCLVVKDFTTVLSSDQGTRSEIYGQLRAIYDGFFEKGFGTLPEPIRVTASIGLIAGVTRIIDKYSQMTGLLGERFLKIRSNPNLRKVTEKASSHAGSEKQMRHELRRAFGSFFSTLNFANAPDFSEDQASQLLEMGLYLGQMRAHVWTTWHGGSIVDMDLASSEVPTRVTKQLRKLARIIAVVLGHEEIGDQELNILRRVVRDTANQKRQMVVDVFKEKGINRTLGITEICEHKAGLHYKTASNQIILMQALDIIETDEHGNHRLTQSFKKLVDAIDLVTEPEEEEKDPENGSFSALVGGEGIGPDDPRFRLLRDGIEALEEHGGEMDPVIFFNYLNSAKGHDMDAVVNIVRTTRRIELSQNRVRLLDTRGEG